MKNAIAIAAGFLVMSCAPEQPKDYHDKLIDFVIGNRSDNFIELPDLYGQDEQPRADFTTDKILLADKLIARGFKPHGAKLSTLPLAGQQMIIQNLSGENCECQVVKTYRATPLISIYAVSEKIKCR